MTPPGGDGSTHFCPNGGGILEGLKKFSFLFTTSLQMFASGRHGVGRVSFFGLLPMASLFPVFPRDLLTPSHTRYTPRPRMPLGIQCIYKGVDRFWEAGVGSFFFFPYNTILMPTRFWSTIGENEGPTFVHPLSQSDHTLGPFFFSINLNGRSSSM